MRPFAYERAADPAARRRRASAARRDVPRRRHEPRRPDEARRRDARRCWSTSRGCRSTAIEELRRRRRCGSAPACATATWPPTRACAPRYPLLAQALLAGASGQLRNMATVGGNLLQRTRCAYFQDVTKPCNKRAPGTGCPARRGRPPQPRHPRPLARCVATHPSDMAVALAAHRRQVHVTGPAGERTIPIARAAPAARRRARARHRARGTASSSPPSTCRRCRSARRSRYRKVRDRASLRLRRRVGRRRARRRRTGRCATSRHRASAASRTRRGAPSAPRRPCAARRRPRRASRPRPTPSWRGGRPLRDNAFKVAAGAQPARPHADRARRGGLMATVATRRVGAPLTRVEGREKVTGQARYAFEHNVEGAAYACGRRSADRQGRGRAPSTPRARCELPGRRSPCSWHGNAPRLAALDDAELAVLQSATVSLPRPDRGARSSPTTLEAAREAAGLLDVEYEAAEHDVAAARRPPGAVRAAEGQPGLRHRHRRGRRGRARSPAPRSRSTRPTRRRRSTTTRWSRTPRWPCGPTAT